MTQTTKQKIAYSGIMFYILYYLVTAWFFITGNDISLICWEVGIMFGAPVMLVVLLSILENTNDKMKSWKIASVAFMTFTIALTGIVHIVSLTVVIPVAASGIIIPDYFKFGQWPSFPMAIEYLAWGGGMGFAFIFGALALPTENIGLKRVKHTMIVAGCLCLLGLFGVIFIDDLLWLIAPVGYCIGTPIICVQMILFYKSTIVKVKNTRIKRR